MFADGRLKQIARGIWTSLDIEGVTATERIRLLAPMMPPAAVLASWAAAELSGLTGLAPLDPQLAPIPIYLPRNAGASAPGFDVLRSDLPIADREYIEGIAVASSGRNAYDTARLAKSLVEAVQVLDRFASVDNRHAVPSVIIEQYLRQHPRYRGNPRVQAALPLMTIRSRSMLESRFQARWLTEVASEPELLMINVTLEVTNAGYEYDFVDLSAGLIIEIDSQHHAGLAQRERDSRKSDFVYDRGLMLLRLNATEIYASTGAFTSRIAARRQAARASGAAKRAAELVRLGALREDPMRSYLT